LRAVLRSVFCGAGRLLANGVAGKKLRSDTDQEAHYTDFEQISLRQTHRQEKFGCNVNVKVYQSAAEQRDPADIVGELSDDMQAREVVHHETSRFRRVGERPEIGAFGKRVELYTGCNGWEALVLVRMIYDTFEKPGFLFLRQSTQVGSMIRESVTVSSKL
jgi:hypothetical protein